MSLPQVSPVLGRPIRQDQAADVGKPTRQFLEAALQSGDHAAALKWLDYLLQEHAIIRDLNSVWAWHLVRYLLDRRGGTAWQAIVCESLANWVGTTAGLADQPVAEVSASGRSAQLHVTGAAWDFFLTEGDTRYHLTLGPRNLHDQRWADRRAAIAAAIRQVELHRVATLLDQQLYEERLVHDLYGDWDWALLTVIARTWGEAILGEVLRVTEEPWVVERYRFAEKLNAEGALQLAVEGMRGHFAGPGRTGQVTVVEEPERYVMSFDPCGSGGRMRRGDAVLGKSSRLDPPYNFLKIQGAYPWTWNRKGVCAYCAHCAVVLQILPIEQIGRPMRMVEYPDDTAVPCRWIVYKQSERFPDEAYTAVGKEPPARSCS